jgi:hypothetical protein
MRFQRSVWRYTCKVGWRAKIFLIWSYFYYASLSQERNYRVVAELTVQTKPVITGANYVSVSALVCLPVAIPIRFQNRLSHCVGEPLNLTGPDEYYAIHCNNWRHSVFSCQLVKGLEQKNDVIAGRSGIQRKISLIASSDLIKEEQSVDLSRYEWSEWTVCACCSSLTL